MIRVERGDMRELLPGLGVTVDAVVTDPPYHLAPLHARFAKAARTPATIGRDAFGRHAAGFMGQAWDGGDIAFRPETWAAVGDVLRPGGFLLAFGGTRTYHRLACAIEDAGFVIQDCLMWLFANGFPKRRDMLKPAYEPIVLAYKPGGPRTLQVNECRVDAAGVDCRRPSAGGDNGLSGTATFKIRERLIEDQPERNGRWPANLAHDGSDEVMAAFPDAPGAFAKVTGREPSTTTRNVLGLYNDRAASIPRGDAGSAARFFFSAKAGELDRWVTQRQELTISWISESGPCQARLLVATALSPARVIAASGSMDEDEWNTFLFGSGLTDLCRKACKSTIRMTTNSIIGLKTWNWLTRSLTNDFTPVATSSMASGSNHVEDAENTSVSISFTLDETASLPNANRALSGGIFAISGQETRVAHPTVKPISLMRWLVKLVTPPGGLVLDPFAGTGTTGLAAMAEGRDAILIERELSYIADIRERVAFYEGGGMHSAKAKHRHRKRDEGPLFAEPPAPPDDWQERDALGCFTEYVQLAGEAVRNGAPLPDFFKSRSETP